MRAVVVVVSTVVVVVGLALSVVAHAAEGLSGTWVLDTAASDSVQPLLEAQGVPGWKRKLADRLTVTQTVTDGGDHLKVAISSRVHSDTQDLPLDGVERIQSGQEGRSALVRSERTDDGAVVTWSTSKADDGRTVALVVRRTLTDDGATMVQALELTVDGQPPVTMKRVFRRQATGD